MGGFEILLMKKIYIIKYDYCSYDVAMSVVGDTVFISVLYIQQLHSIFNLQSSNNNLWGLLLIHFCFLEFMDLIQIGPILDYLVQIHCIQTIFMYEQGQTNLDPNRKRKLVDAPSNSITHYNYLKKKNIFHVIIVSKILLKQFF